MQRPGDWSAAFWADERGVGTVQSLFFAIMFLLIGGIAIDGTNFWRNHQLMQQTADSASHAGAVEIALGNAESEVRTKSQGMVEANMPLARYGNLYSSSTDDIKLLNYDPASNTLSTSGKPNAVSVTLHRDDRSGNPLNTLVLRISDLMSFGPDTDLSTMDLVVNSVATVASTRRCVSTDGVYARGQIRLSSSSSFGPGYCLHSQTELWMPQQNSFAPTAGLSMPDLVDCGSKCSDSANPGATAASFEMNLIMQDLNVLVLDTKAAFLGTSGSTATKTDFFASKTLDIGKFSALEDAGINTSGLGKGSVVTMTDGVFESLTAIPGGLVYDVRCSAGGNGPNSRLTIDSSNGGNALKDAAVITNCSLDFGSDADVTSSLLLTTRQSSTATVNASSGAHIGTTGGGCNANAQSYIMALGDVHVPADFAGSNISILVDGDIHLSASSSSSSIDHTGLSLHASGEIDIASNHTFNGCNTPPSGLQPSLRVIRHIAPDMTTASMSY